MSAALSVVAAAVFAAFAVLHVYWGVGGVWPGHDAESLALTVVGGRRGMRMPGLAACVAVTALLAALALATLQTGGWFTLPLPLPAAWARWMLLLGSGGLALRGVAGFFDARLRPETVGSRFVRLNVSLYSPLCLVLALLLAVVDNGSR